MQSLLDGLPPAMAPWLHPDWQKMAESFSG